MNISVTVREKKEFLTWLMDYLKQESYEINWFLNDLYENEYALEHICFVPNVKDFPKGILLAKGLQDHVTFHFFKGNVRTSDVYTAYHELQLYHTEQFYIQVDLPESQINTLYYTVLGPEADFGEKIKRNTDELLNTLLYTGRQSFLNKKINWALEQGNHDAFIFYSNQLNAMDENSDKGWTSNSEMEQS